MGPMLAPWTLLSGLQWARCRVTTGDHLCRDCSMRRQVNVSGMLLLRHLLWSVTLRFLCHRTSTLCNSCTIDSRYIAFIFDTIVHTAQQLQWQNFGHLCHPLYEEKRPRYIDSALHYAKYVNIGICFRPRIFNQLTWIGNIFPYSTYSTFSERKDNSRSAYCSIFRQGREIWTNEFRNRWICWSIKSM